MPLAPVLKPLIIVPTYNEVDNVQLLIDGLFSACQNANLAVHILFVDDNSQDGTRDVIALNQAKHPGRVHLLHRPGKMGLGTAYIAGFRWALERDYDGVVDMDADLSHNPADVPRVIAALSDLHVVIASRYVAGGGTRNWSKIRQLISRAGSLYARTILSLNVRDLTGGFNGIRREVLAKIPLNLVTSQGYSFQIELKFRAHLAGFSMGEIPILFVERRAGHSKMSSTIVVEAMLKVLTFAWRRNSMSQGLI